MISRELYTLTQFCTLIFKSWFWHNVNAYSEDTTQEWSDEKKLAHAPTIVAFLWLVLDTHLISISQVPTHVRLDLGKVIEELT